MTIKDRITTNPGVYGLVLGGLAALVAMLLRLVTIEGPTGSSSIWGLKTVTGTSLLLAAILVMLCGGGVALSNGKGRIWWALLGGVFALVILLFGLLCLFNAEEAAIRMAYAQAYTVATGSEPGQGVADAYRAAFDAGTLSAKANFGAILAVIGGAAAIVGAAISMGRASKPFTPDL